MRETTGERIRILVSAGEASGDLYGALLVEALQRRLGAVEFFGCGGEKLRAAGCRTLVDAHSITMVGLTEVIPGLARAWKALRRLRRAIREERPALAVLIDFPDFNLRLARELKRQGTAVVYFVAPQVWAWRGWRVRAIRRCVDRLLCIFPFEEEYFRRRGVPAEFVGHPLVGRAGAQMGEAEFREWAGIPQARRLIALLPGSRRKEVLLNLPPMLESAERLAATGDYSFVIPCASTTPAGWVRGLVKGCGVPVAVVDDHANDAISHAAAAVVASGTAATETAFAGTPMVVVYRVSRTTWWLGSWLVKVPFFSMVNLIAGQEVVPEFIQGRFRPEEVAQAVRQLVETPGVRQRMQRGLQEVADRLRPPVKDRNISARAGQAAPENEDAIQRAAAIVESIVRGKASGVQRDWGGA